MAMDLKLWGDLQNHMAHDRRCLTVPLRKPCIIVVHKNDISHNEVHSFYGMLTFDIATSSVTLWRSTNRHPAASIKPFHILCKAFSVKNLTFDRNQSPFIYEVHIQRSRQIPQAPEIDPHDPYGELGIPVYFSQPSQLILVSVDTVIQVYDSVMFAWTTSGSNGSESPGSESEKGIAATSSEDEGGDDLDEDNKSEGNSSESDGNGSDQDDNDGVDGDGNDDEDGPPSSSGESEDEGLDEPDDHPGSDSDGSS